MRITSEAMVTRSLDRLHARLSQYERAQTELATGRRILQPSDDPAGTRRAMSLESALRARERELTNVDDARGWLDTADTQLQTASSRLIRVRELITQGASSLGQEARNALASEVDQIIDEFAGLANTKHLSRPLFGGFGHGDQVVKQDGVWQYPDSRQTGMPDQVMRRVSDSEQVRINVTAAEWLGIDNVVDDNGDTVEGPKLLNYLERVAHDLRSGASTTTISGHLGQLHESSTRVQDNLALIGAATNRVESARARTMDLQLTLKTELSQVQDLDLAQGMMEMQVQQVAYEATLQALGKALPPSLVAFLR